MAHLVEDKPEVVVLQHSLLIECSFPEQLFLLWNMHIPVDCASLEIKDHPWVISVAHVGYILHYHYVHWRENVRVKGIDTVDP